jgi:NO-binding membrane sensor protein with MHYT domain/two-component sensor histidine kinase
MSGTYDYWLVLLSVIVSITASFVALNLASRVVASPGRRGRRYWLAGGALSMGAGIWSMHFIGMLAFRLPIPISYDLWITLFSLLIAVVSSWFALYLASRGTLSPRTLVSGGALLGIGIVSMHYTGMAAMQMIPPIRYEPWLYGLSILIAVFASIVALWSAFRLRLETIWSAFWKKAGSALTMGGAISGMHYSGMAAAIFAPDSICAASPQDINHGWLAVALGGSILGFLTISLLVSVFDGYLAEHSAKFAERERLSRDLHDHVLQAIYALGMRLEETQRQSPPDSAAQLGDIVASLNTVIRDIRGYISGSPQQILNYPQFRAELEKLIEIAEGTAGPRFELDADPSAFAQLTAAEAEQVLHIAREAVSNSMRHSRAGHGKLTLLAVDGGVVLEIADDGIGFDRNAHGGSGLRNIRSRARQIGARLDISSTPGGGTRIAMVIPKRKTAAN